MSVESGATREAQPLENGATPAAPAVGSGNTNGSLAQEGSAPAAVGTASSTGAKKEPVLTPAPLPVKSPWKSVSRDIPVSNIPVGPLEPIKRNKPKSTNAGSVKSSSSTKWVPMKASIVVSGSKRPGSGKKGSSKGSQPTGPGGNKSSNGAPKKKKQPGQQTQKRQQQHLQQPPAQQQQQQQPEHDQQQQLLQEVQAASIGDGNISAAAIENDSNVDRDNLMGGKSKDVSSDDEELKSSPEGSQQNRDHFSKHTEVEHPYRKQHNFNNQHHPRQQGGFQRRRYYNNFNHSHNNYVNEAYKNPQGFQHHPKGSYPPYHGGMGRPFNHHYHPRFPGPAQQHQPLPPMYQQQFHPMQAIMVAVNSVARQLEYYFSSENLQKDEYLRSKLSKEGYAPATMIAKFYRVNNMSFGGDPYLILASLREIVANEQSTVDVAVGSLLKSNAELQQQDEESPLSKYFIRSKDWSNWLPEQVSTEVVVEKVLEGDELEEYMIAPVPVPPVYGPGPGPAPVPAPVPAPIVASSFNEKEQEEEEKE